MHLLVKSAITPNKILKTAGAVSCNQAIDVPHLKLIDITGLFGIFCQYRREVQKGLRTNLYSVSMLSSAPSYIFILIYQLVGEH